MTLTKARRRLLCAAAATRAAVGGAPPPRPAALPAGARLRGAAPPALRPHTLAAQLCRAGREAPGGHAGRGARRDGRALLTDTNTLGGGGTNCEQKPCGCANTYQHVLLTYYFIQVLTSFYALQFSEFCWAVRSRKPQRCQAQALAL